MTAACPDPFDEIVTLGDIVEFFGVAGRTPLVWVDRGRMPPADRRISHALVWYRSTIAEWMDGIAAVAAARAEAPA